MPGRFQHKTAVIAACLCLHWIAMPYAAQWIALSAVHTEVEHQEQETNAEESGLELDVSMLAALLTYWTFNPVENNVDVHQVSAWDRLLDGTLLDPPERHA